MSKRNIDDLGGKLESLTDDDFINLKRVKKFEEKLTEKFTKQLKQVKIEADEKAYALEEGAKLEHKARLDLEDRFNQQEKRMIELEDLLKKSHLTNGLTKPSANQ